MRLVLTTSLIAILGSFSSVACNGGGEPTTSASGTEGSSGSSETGTTAPTTSTTTETSMTTSGGSNSGTGSTSGPEPTTGPETTTTTTGPETTTGTTTDVGSTGEGSTSTTGPDTTSGGSTGGSTTGEPLLCPPEPGDTMCQACIKENCCDEAIACGMDVKCTCFFACLGEGMNGQQCAMMCMVGNPGQNPNIAGLFECTNGSCDQQCG